jgi:hypothetical protein
MVKTTGVRGPTLALFMKGRLRGVPPPENMQFEMKVCKL